MCPVISFHSRFFDVSLEPENPINPIRGMSLLAWLQERVPAGLQMTDPDAEDWGWYASANWQGRTYLVGACVHESADGDHEWMLQVDKQRSFRERLLGRARMEEDDPCFLLLKGIIAGEPSFTRMSVEFGP